MANKVITQLSGDTKRPAGSQWLPSFVRESSGVTFSPSPQTSVLLVHLVPDGSPNVGQDLSFILGHHWESLNRSSLCCLQFHASKYLPGILIQDVWQGYVRKLQAIRFNRVDFLTLKAWRIVPKRQTTLWLFEIRFQPPWLIGSTYGKRSPCYS